MSLPGSRRAIFLLPLLAFAAACQQPAIASEAVVRAPAAQIGAKESKGLKTAIFAGGCFWGVEGVFSHMKGVTSAVSGYHGGTKSTADYKAVTAGRSQHAEAVKVTYDPAIVRYDQLLRVFFSVITDPTQLNRQGPDRGAQYRSALVPLNSEQARVASAYLKQLGKADVWGKPIVTRIEKHRAFFPAETYHQDFMLKNPRHPYIQAWDAPKVSAFQEMYPAWYKSGFTKR